jgi:hypothetical protein
VVVTLASGQTQSARTVVDLDPGQRRALSLGGFSLSPLRIYVLTVTVGPVAGETRPFDAQQMMPIAVAG